MGGDELALSAPDEAPFATRLGFVAAFAACALAFIAWAGRRRIGYFLSLDLLKDMVTDALPVAAAVFLLSALLMKTLATGSKGIPSGAYEWLAGLALIFALVIVFVFNAALDRSEGVERAFPVVGYERICFDFTRESSVDCIDFASQPDLEPSHQGNRGEGAGTVKVYLAQDESRQVKVGRTLFATTVHPGAFGFPWFVRAYYRFEAAPPLPR